MRGEQLGNADPDAAALPGLRFFFEPESRLPISLPQILPRVNEHASTRTICASPIIMATRTSSRLSGFAIYCIKRAMTHAVVSFFEKNRSGERRHPGAFPKLFLHASADPERVQKAQKKSRHDLAGAR